MPICHIRNSANVSLIALALSASTVLISSLPTAARADPVYAATGQIVFNGEPGRNPSEQSTPVSTGLVSDSQDTAQGSYLAAAGVGQLHGLSQASLSAGSAPSAVAVISKSYFTIDDVIFTSSSATTVTTSLNLMVDGSLRSSGDTGKSSSYSDATLSYDVFDANNDYSNDRSTVFSSGPGRRFWNVRRMSCAMVLPWRV